VSVQSFYQVLAHDIARMLYVQMQAMHNDFLNLIVFQVKFIPLVIHFLSLRFHHSSSHKTYEYHCNIQVIKSFKIGIHVAVNHQKMT